MRDQPPLRVDDTSLAYLDDPRQRAMMAAQGADSEHLHERYIRIHGVSRASPVMRP
jgi:hypothetical protein